VASRRGQTTYRAGDLPLNLPILDVDKMDMDLGTRFSPRTDSAGDNYPCPLCRATEREPIRGVGSFRRCRCGLVVNARREPPEGYEGDYFTADEPEKGHRDFESAAARNYDLQRFGEELDGVGPPPPGGRLLDVGSATGSFLDVASRRGWNVVGVEISEGARALARSRGVDSRPDLGSVADLAPFDLITLHHVVEHLGDPRNTLRQLLLLLADEGRLLIEVPNWSSFERRSMGEQWTDLRPEQHRWHFRPSTMRRLCESAGLTVQSITTRGEPVPTPRSLARSLAVPDRWLDGAGRRRPTGIATPSATVPHGSAGMKVSRVAKVVDGIESRALVGKRLVVIATA